MTKLIGAYNEPDNGPRPKHPLLHALRHIHARTLLSGVPRSTSSQLVSVTRTRPSRFRFTPT